MPSLSISSANTEKGCLAFKKGEKLNIRLFVEDGCERIYFYLGCDEKVIIEREVTSFLSDDKKECVFVIPTEEFCESDGLFFCHFEYEAAGSRFYSAFGEEGCYISGAFVNELQFTVCNNIYSSPEWICGKAMYQIFPDRFARGGNCVRKPDAVYNDDWENGIPEYPSVPGEPFPNNTHFGGTLWGVAENIGYLKQLGIGCIYLNPIFKAFSNHKYDTGDFLRVDETFGGDEALIYLIKKAHNNGIAVILDGVFNHVGDDSVYFDAYGKYGNGACSDKSSPYYEWFSFSEYPKVYESWWGIKNLPKVKRVESYRKFITQTVIPKYMRMGIDGWRLDVADELESDFLDDIVKAIKTEKSDALVIGEVWEDASDKIAYGERKRYFRGSQLDSVTNYPLRNAVIDTFSYGDASPLAETLNTLYAHYPPEKLACVMNFLGSHDTERIATVFGGDADIGYTNKELAEKYMSPDARRNAVRLLENAYILLASLPGVPCIYYGDEYAMEGYHDPFNRRPFNINKKEEKLFESISRLNRLRSVEPLFSSRRMSASVCKNGVCEIIRYGDGEDMYILVNPKNTANEYIFENHSYCNDMLNGESVEAAVLLPPQSVRIIKSANKRK